jgi:hypothetical protein
MSWQRRGDFSHLIRTLRERHRYRDEIKWQHVRRSTLPFYKDLVSAFFRAPWLGFHALVVRRPVVRRELHASCDEARQKHFGMLLRAKIVKCLRAHPDRKQTVGVYVDPLHSSYSKAVEVLEKIMRAVVQRTFPDVTIEGAFERDSKETPTIQLCDVLLGAVMSAWDREPASGAKAELRAFIAEHLGWRALRADTRPNERKFNV